MTQRFTFLLLPGFSLMSLASALEPLRSLNRLVGAEAYSWQLASVAGGIVEASNGIPLPTIAARETLPATDFFLVCGGLRIPGPGERDYYVHLRQALRQGAAIGAISTGSHLLARAGLLDGYRSTIHWENRTAFREDFPDVECTDRIFEIDRDRLTCSGGTAALDMMLHLIAERHGADLARDVANQFHHEHIRDQSDLQRGSRHEVLAHMPDRVREAIEIMQDTIEEPLPLSAVARAVGIGPRQLERLFLRYLGMKPSRFYMQLRVERARELLIYSDLRIIDVAVSAGFKSSSHLSAWHKRVFGTRPSELRGRDQH